jgi:hypothetical protein
MELNPCDHASSQLLAVEKRNPKQETLETSEDERNDQKERLAQNVFMNEQVFADIFTE